ncbi:hypothetical protein [Gelria sp. Kuro-4]|uniref:hypothetical protein n=1 Tax=Gelria sp. Kuro-4 TaxID=2796927 RepID=UPI001BF14266|nr:hypothetical protein [Gelria sp. Kuro-4]BCV23296.1 hypothetical protein kuro4_00690 [Gelria sp. Kuro-4]
MAQDKKDKPAAAPAAPEEASLGEQAASQASQPKEPEKPKEPETPADMVPAAEEPAAPEDNPVAMLAVLLQNDPELALKIADVIEQHYGGGSMFDNGAPGMPPASPMAPANPPATPTPPAAQAAQGIAPSAGAAIPPELIDRLGRVESAQADMMLERELGEAKQEYATLKEQLPILPDLNDQELLQIALERDGLPLKEALYIWAMQKMKSGEGPIADRIAAAVMSKSKARGLPPVEGKGGTIPSGEAPQATSLKQAQAMAKDRLRAMFSSTPGK